MVPHVSTQMAYQHIGMLSSLWDFVVCIVVGLDLIDSSSDYLRMM